MSKRRSSYDGLQKNVRKLKTPIKMNLTQINANQTQIYADLDICDHLRVICENLR